MTNTCTIQKETCGFKCTGYEGGKVWTARMKETKKIECETCRDHAVKDESGYHDHVNTGLGQKPHNLSNYKRYVIEVKCVFDECIKSGRC